MRNFKNCEVCGNPLKYGQWANHHVSYNPEKIINVCSSCHGKIHHSKTVLNPFRNLIPSQKTIKNPIWNTSKRYRFKTISIDKKHNEWIQHHDINLSKFVRRIIEEKMKSKQKP